MGLCGVRLRAIGLRRSWFALCLAAVWLSLLISVPPPAAPGYLVFAWLSLLACAVDGAERRLPNRLTLPLAVVVPVLLAGAAAVAQQADRTSRMLLGAAALAAVYLLLHLANPAGLGFGDVKLSVSVGCALGWAGWDAWWAGALLGPFLGASAGVLLIVRRRAIRGGAAPLTLPFGPPMVAGAVAGLATLGAA